MLSGKLFCVNRTFLYSVVHVYGWRGSFVVFSAHFRAEGVFHTEVFSFVPNNDLSTSVLF